MTSQREQRRAQMAAAAGRRAEPAARPRSDRYPVQAGPDHPRPQPGLPAVTRWVDEAAVELDVPRVALVDAVRAMIRVTTQNPNEVLDRLRRDRNVASPQ